MNDYGHLAGTTGGHFACTTGGRFGGTAEGPLALTKPGHLARTAEGPLARTKTSHLARTAEHNFARSTGGHLDRTSEGKGARAARAWAALMLAALLALVSTGAAQAATCGNGVLEAPSEECDPGGDLYINGDPTLATCTTGNDCFYAYSCCKFNCQFPGQGAPCDDNDSCSENEKCDAVGNCGTNADKIILADGTACDDELFCTGNDQCLAGVCSGTTDPCADGNLCTDDLCNEAAQSCSNPNNSDPCDDGLYCTTSDTCSGGACGGSARDCSDGNDCTDDSCNEGLAACDHINNTAPCEDGLFCTVADTCSGGVCLSGVANTCDDANDCTDDSCNEATKACDNVADDTNTCNDGLYCVVADHCDGGVCVGNPRNCSDGNFCTDDFCKEDIDSCVNRDNSLPCDDGLFCTIEDTCALGACSGVANTCDDDEVCTADSCDEGADLCVNTDTSGGSCDDGDACTTDDICNVGICEPGPPLICDDSNICTDDSCDTQTGCVFDPNSDPCDDGLFCTVDDVCAEGECGGSERDCGDDNICTDDICDEAADACSNPDNTAPCDDGDLCTEPDLCSGGACNPGPLLDCDDGNLCTDDACDSATGCVSTDNQLPCDDGNPCTLSDICSGGVCFAPDSTCGDGTVDAACGESCDDGNNADGDGCSASCTVEPPSQLLLTAVDGPDPVPPGTSFTYTITYSNDSAVTLTGVVLTVQYDPALSFVASSPDPAADTTDTWNIGDLEPGQSGTILVRVLSAPDLTDGALLLSIASISADGDVSAQVSETTTIAVGGDGSAQLRVDIAAEPGTASAGDVIAYTLSYVNYGQANAVDATLSAALDPLMSFGDASIDATASDQSQATWSLGTLAPGESGTITVFANVDGDVTAGSAATSCAEIAASAGEGGVASAGLAAQSCVTTTVRRACDVWLAKSLKISPIVGDGTLTLSAAPPPGGAARAVAKVHSVAVAGNSNVRPGNPVRYTLRYSNISVSNVLTANLPPQITVTSLSPAAAADNGQDFIWINLPAPSGNVVIDGIVAEDAEVGSLLTVSSVLTNDSAVDAFGSYSTAVIEPLAPSPDASAAPEVTVSGLSSVRPGRTLTFIVRYSGADDASTMVVDLGADLAITSVTPAAASSDGGVLTWSGLPAATGKLTIAALVPQEAAASYTATATLTAQSGESASDSFETAVLANIPVDDAPAVTVSGNSSVRAGRSLSVSVRYSGATAQNTLAIELPEGLTLESVTPEPSSQEAGLLRFENLAAPTGTVGLSALVAEDLENGSLLLVSALLTNSDAGSAGGSFETSVLSSGSVLNPDPQGKGIRADYRIDWMAPCNVVWGVSVSDAVPSDLDMVTATLKGGGSVDGNDVAFAPGMLRPGTRGTALISGRLRNDTPAGTVVANEAVLTEPSGLRISDQARFLAPATGGASQGPALEVSGNSIVRSGRIAQITARYSEVTAANKLVLSLPGQMGIGKIRPDGAEVNGGVVTWRNLPAPAGKVSVRGTVNAAEGVAAALIASMGTVANEDGAIASGAWTASLLNTTKASADQGRTPHLKLSGKHFLHDGRTVRMTLRYKNIEGLSSLQLALPAGLEVTETLPAASSQGGGVVEWTGLEGSASGKVSADVLISVPPGTARGDELTSTATARLAGDQELVSTLTSVVAR